MNRYYLLTQREGVRVIEADTVQQSGPFSTHFLTSSGIKSFDRQELLWWCEIDSSLPAPFSDFGPALEVGCHGIDAHQTPWDVHGLTEHRSFPTIDFHECAAASKRELEKAVLAAVPSTWRNVVLELKVSYELAVNRYKVTHRLHNPDTGAEVIDFSDSLFTLIDVYHRIHVLGGQNWTRSTLAIELDGRGRCRPTANFEYGTNFSETRA